MCSEQACYPTLESASRWPKYQHWLKIVLFNSSFLAFIKKNQLIERWTDQVADEGLIFVDKQWSKRERLFSFIYRNTFGVLLSVFFSFNDEL